MAFFIPGRQPQKSGFTNSTFDIFLKDQPKRGSRTKGGEQGNKKAAAGDRGFYHDIIFM